MNLEFGEVICDKCNGTDIFSNQVFCPKCFGTGKLTWIENIFGKNIDKTKPNINAKDHSDKNEIGSIAWCINNLSDNGIIKLESGVYNVNGTIFVDKNLNIRGNNATFNNAVINIKLNCILTLDGTHSKNFTFSNNTIIYK